MGTSCVGMDGDFVGKDCVGTDDVGVLPTVIVSL